jgi:membrane-bound lytic murein transglycosylase C
MATAALFALIMIGLGAGVAQAVDSQTTGQSQDTVVRSSIEERQNSAYEAFKRSQENRYESFQRNRKADFDAYMETMREGYARYRDITEEVEAQERARLSSRWEEAELSSATVWLEYSDDDRERRRVDFEAGTVVFESFENGSELDSPAGLRDRIRALLVEDRVEAFARDRVAQGIERRSRQQIEELETAPVVSAPIMWPYLTGQSEIEPAQLDAVVDWLAAQATFEQIEVQGETMQRAEIPLDASFLLTQLDRLQSGDFAATMPKVPVQEIPRPDFGAMRAAKDRSEALPPRKKQNPLKATEPPRSAPVTPQSPAQRTGKRLPARARAVLPAVARHADPRGIDRALMFAIIESESAFNPLARSPAPAYGLMQIVPRSAGQDASAVLFGRPRILAPSYLFDAERNIEIGAIYLEILMERYLVRIRDPESRLYCAIAAYNTGAGNVFRAFTGRTRPKAAAAKINSMTPDDVYRTLIWQLPYKETRTYLANVRARMAKY